MTTAFSMTEPTLFKEWNPFHWRLCCTYGRGGQYMQVWTLNFSIVLIELTWAFLCDLIKLPILFKKWDCFCWKFPWWLRSNNMAPQLVVCVCHSRPQIPRKVEEGLNYFSCHVGQGWMAWRMAFPMHCTHPRSHTRVYIIAFYYVFCNLIRALRSGNYDKKSRSEHQTLLTGGSGDCVYVLTAAVWPL